MPPNPPAATAPESKPVTAPKSKAAPVPFVCENDVRDALRENRKIVVGRKTIITPAARELGDSRKVFETGE
jgi:hypothetical protein